jgi:hypothetical protein
MNYFVSCGRVVLRHHFDHRHHCRVLRCASSSLVVVVVVVVVVATAIVT